MSILETRHDQMFPTLDPGQVETAKRFASGPIRHFEPGEIVFDIGQRNAPAWLVLKGAIDVTRRNALGTETPCVTLFNCTSPWEIYDYGIQKKIISPRLEEFFYKRNFDRCATTAITVEEVLCGVMSQLQDSGIVPHHSIAK